MRADYATLADTFERHELDKCEFSHADHVGVAYELLGRYDFLTATVTYARGIKTLAEKAGAPDKFNTTITFAFLSLIAERMNTTAHSEYGDFIRGNEDLLSSDVLSTWYDRARLASDLGRTIFLLPSADTRTGD